LLRIFFVIIEGINLQKKYGFGRGKTEKGFWGVTKEEGKGFLKIKFYARVILLFWGVTRIMQGVIRKTHFFSKF